MKNDTLYVCNHCYRQELHDNSKPEYTCPDCKKEGYEGKLLKVNIAASSSIREISNVPGVGRANVCFSIEAIQDIQALNAAFKYYNKVSEPTPEEIEMWEKLSDPRIPSGSIRTKEPTPTEIEEWQSYDKMFSAMSPDKFDEIKKKYNVKFFRDDTWEAWADDDEE